MVLGCISDSCLSEELMISATRSSLHVANGRTEFCMSPLSLSCPCHGSAAEVGTLQLDCSPYLLPALLLLPRVLDIAVIVQRGW